MGTKLWRLLVEGYWQGQSISRLDYRPWSFNKLHRRGRHDRVGVAMNKRRTMRQSLNSFSSEHNTQKIKRKSDKDRRARCAHLCLVSFTICRRWFHVQNIAGDLHNECYYCADNWGLLESLFKIHVLICRLVMIFNSSLRINLIGRNHFVADVG